MANYGPNVWYTQGNTGINPFDLLTANNAAGATLTQAGIYVPSGALILVAVTEFGSVTAGSLSDGGTNTYTLLTSELMSGSVGIVMLFYTLNALALTNATFTYTKGLTGDKASMSLQYVLGIAASSAVDATVTAVAQGSSTTPSVISGAPGTTGEYIVGVVGWDGGGAYTLTNVAPFATPFDTVNTQNAASLGGGCWNSSATTAVTYAPTLSTTAPWASIIAGFKPASAPIGWWAVAPFSVSASVSFGALYRQLAPVAVGNERVFVVTTPGTNAGSEPAWTITKGGQTTSNTAVYTEVTGQPAVNGDDAAATTAATSASTAAGSNVLTFSAVPANMSVGLLALNKSTAAVIPGRTTVMAFTPTTVTLSNNVAGAGVGNGDTIAFSNTPQWQDIGLGGATAVTTGYVIQDKTGAHLFIVTTGGNTGTTEPTWNTTTGASTTDSGVTWKCLGATGAFSKLAAPHARLTNARAWGAAGNVFWIADNHAEIQSLSMSLKGPGTITSPDYNLCFDHTASLPPSSSNLKSAATITNSANTAINVYGYSYYYGCQFLSQATSGTALQLANAVYTNLDTCVFNLNGGSGTALFSIGSASGISYARLHNTQVSFSAVGQTIKFGSGNYVWDATPNAIQGSALPTILIQNSTVSGSANIRDVDFSAYTSGTIIGAGSTGAFNFILRDCKFNSGATIAATPANASGSRVDVITSDSIASTYQQQRYWYQGTLVPDTTVTMTGGASDGVTAIAWKITTTANVVWPFPFETFPIGLFFPNSLWSNGLGLSSNFNVRGIVNAAAVPLNDQLWMEVEYLGSATSTLGSFATTGKTSPIASGISLTADTTAWDSQVAARQNSHAYSVGNTITVGGGQVWFCTTSGTSAGSQPGGYTSAADGTSVTDGTAVFRAGCRFVMNVSVTPQLAGYIYARIKAAGVSTSYWIDPLIQAS